MTEDQHSWMTKEEEVGEINSRQESTHLLSIQLEEKLNEEEAEVEQHPHCCFDQIGQLLHRKRHLDKEPWHNQNTGLSERIECSTQDTLPILSAGNDSQRGRTKMYTHRCQETNM